MYLLGILGGAIAGAATWYLSAFLATPIRNFFDLRREVRRQLLVFDEREVWVRHDDGVMDNAAGAKAEEKLTTAKRSLRDVGAQIIALGESEWLAVKLLKLIGYDPVNGGENLIIAAEHLGGFGPQFQAARNQAYVSLRFDR